MGYESDVGPNPEVAHLKKKWLSKLQFPKVTSSDSCQWHSSCHARIKAELKPKAPFSTARRCILCFLGRATENSAGVCQGMCRSEKQPPHWIPRQSPL